MRTQLQAISLRIQTVRSNEQMMQSMRGATAILGSMNRSMNLPQLQRIAMEFEKENDIMDQRQEMMDDSIDDVTAEDETEGDEIIEQVLEEIGVDMNQTVSVQFQDVAFGVSVLTLLSWVPRHRVFRRMSCQKAESHRLSVGAGEVEMLATMSCKPGLIVSEDRRSCI